MIVRIILTSTRQQLTAAMEHRDGSSGGINYREEVGNGDIATKNGKRNVSLNFPGVPVRFFILAFFGVGGRLFVFWALTCPYGKNIDRHRY